MSRKVGETHPQGTPSRPTPLQRRGSGVTVPPEEAAPPDTLDPHEPHAPHETRPPASTPGVFSKSIHRLTRNVRGTWLDASLALQTFVADAHDIPFAGHTLSGDDHLAGPDVYNGAAATRLPLAHRQEQISRRGTGAALADICDHCYGDLTALQDTPQYRTYKHALAAIRLFTGTLSPLQAGIYVGSSALPLIDARLPRASEAARVSLQAAAIVADPIGFAAGTAMLIGARMALQHAPPNRRVFWQCMVFLLTRQVSSRLLDGM